MPPVGSHHVIVENTDAALNIDVLFEKAEQHILRFKMSFYSKIWVPMKKSQLATISRSGV